MNNLRSAGEPRGDPADQEMRVFGARRRVILAEAVTLRHHSSLRSVRAWRPSGAVERSVMRWRGNGMPRPGCLLEVPAPGPRGKGPGGAAGTVRRVLSWHGGAGLGDHSLRATPP
jgi:hypothetical protein